MLDVIAQSPGCNVNAVCNHFDVSRIAVMKHLATLEKAGLVVSEKSGRDRSLYFNAIPIQLIVDRWTNDYSALWARELTVLKHQIEHS